MGGAPCIDFINTVSWRGRAQSIERLNSYADVLSCCYAWGLLSKRQMVALSNFPPAKATAALVRARSFREATRNVLLAAARREKPAVADMDFVNAVLARARARQVLHVGDGRLSWQIVETPDADLPLRLVALSFADLIGSDDVCCLRECDGAGCGWMFLDETKNHSRRWCAMNDCGNREKARRHYARSR